MILEFDYGNTRLKWRLLDADSLECSAHGAVTDILDLVPSLQKAGCLKLQFCRACSVRSDAENMQLTALIKRNYGVAITYAQSVKKIAGVTNGYLHANKLGVDRWLAIVAAYSKLKCACVVIDCGTAVTADYIAADGQHLGGCIAPGLKMLRAMLQKGTQLSIDAGTPLFSCELRLGCNTQAAVDAGVVAMYRGFLGEQLKVAEELLGASFSVLCTGGDSALVYAVTDKAVCEKDLVFSGLGIVCPQVARE